VKNHNRSIRSERPVNPNVIQRRHEEMQRETRKPVDTSKLDEMYRNDPDRDGNNGDKTGAFDHGRRY
jgi:hypothetical protein